MTDKERLEEIKAILRDYQRLQKQTDFGQADTALLHLAENHVVWLIQQAEREKESISIKKHNQILHEFKVQNKQLMKRVEELERDGAEWEIEAHTQNTRNKRLEQQNKRYKQALENTIKYADDRVAVSIIANEALEESE